MTHHPQAQPQHRGMVLGVVYLIRGVVIKYLWVYFCSAGKLGGYVCCISRNYYSESKCYTKMMVCKAHLGMGTWHTHL